MIFHLLASRSLKPEYVTTSSASIWKLKLNSIPPQLIGNILLLYTKHIKSSFWIEPFFHEQSITKPVEKTYIYGKKNEDEITYRVVDVLQTIP